MWCTCPPAGRKALTAIATVAQAQTPAVETPQATTTKEPDAPAAAATPAAPVAASPAPSVAATEATTAPVGDDDADSDVDDEELERMVQKGGYLGLKSTFYVVPPASQDVKTGFSIELSDMMDTSGALCLVLSYKANVRARITLCRPTPAASKGMPAACRMAAQLLSPQWATYRLTRCERSQ